VKDKMFELIEKIVENPKSVFHFIGFLLISSIISFGIYETTIYFAGYLSQAEVLDIYIYSSYDPITAIFVVAGTWIVVRAFYSNRYDPEKPISIAWNFIRISIALTVVYIGSMIVAVTFFNSMERIFELGAKYYTWPWAMVILVVSLKLNIVASGLKTYRNNAKRSLGDSFGLAVTLLFFIIGMAYVFVNVFNLFLFEAVIFSLIYKSWHFIFLLVLEVVVFAMVLDIFIRRWVKNFLVYVGLFILAIPAIYTAFYTYNFYIEKNMTLEERCLEKKRGVVCYSIAYKYTKDGKIVDSEKFLKWAEKGCEYEHQQSCVSLAYFWYFGDGGKVDKEKAYNYASDVCKNAIIASIGKEVEKLTPKSEEYWSFEACGFLAARFYALKDGEKRDLESAEKFGKLACDRSIKSGCVALKFVEYQRKEDKNKKEK